MSTNVVREAGTAAGAWTRTRGAGTVVAVVDESVETECHEDFAGRVLPGYLTSSDNSRRHFHRTHGTKVAGLAVACGRELTGLAPEALLLPVAVPTLNSSAEGDREAHALRWAAD